MNVRTLALFAAMLTPLYASAATVFSADQDATAISVVDLSAGHVRKVALPIYPHNVDTCGRERVLVVGSDASMTGMGGDDEMPMPGKLIDVNPLRLAVTRTMTVGLHPAHVVCDPSARRAFVTLAQENAVAAIDIASFRTIAKIAVGKHPHGLRMSADGRRLVVANQEGRSLSVINVATLRELERIAVPGNPVQVAVNANGTVAYATLGAQNAVVAVDLVAKRVTQRVAVGRNPAQLTMSADGRRLVVANQGTQEHPDDRVSLLDARNLTALHWVRTGAGPHGVAIDPADRRAYVTCAYSGTLAVIDIERATVVTNYAVGANPNGVTYLQ